MKTIRYKKIDGYKVITGFDKLQTDPVATRKHIITLMEQTTEHADFKAAEAALGDEYTRLRSIHGIGVRLESPELDRLKGRYTVARAAFVTALDRCRHDNPVYFEMRQFEVAADNLDDIKSKVANLALGERLTVDGEVVIDHRGVEYYKNGTTGWKLYVWDKFNKPLPDGAVPPESMTSIQQAQLMQDEDSRRIAGLSGTERFNEMQVALKSAATHAVQRRLEDEVKGVPEAEALDSAKQLHKMLIKEIEQRYQ